MSDTKTPTPKGPGNVIMKRDQEVVQEYVEQGRRQVTNNDQEIQVRILADALRSSDVGELLNPRAVESAADVLDEPLEVDSFDLNASEHKSGLGYYAIVSATLLRTGRRTTFQCGAPEVVLKLQHAEAMGWLPMQAKVVELNEAKDGRNAALGLVALDAFDMQDVEGPEETASKTP